MIFCVKLKINGKEKSVIYEKKESFFRGSFAIGLIEKTCSSRVRKVPFLKATNSQRSVCRTLGVIFLVEK